MHKANLEKRPKGE